MKKLIYFGGVLAIPAFFGFYAQSIEVWALSQISVFLGSLSVYIITATISDLVGNRIIQTLAFRFAVAWLAAICVTPLAFNVNSFLIIAGIVTLILAFMLVKDPDEFADIVSSGEGETPSIITRLLKMISIIALYCFCWDTYFPYFRFPDQEAKYLDVILDGLRFFNFIAPGAMVIGASNPAILIYTRFAAFRKPPSFILEKLLQLCALLAATAAVTLYLLNSSDAVANACAKIPGPAKILLGGLFATAVLDLFSASIKYIGNARFVETAREALERIPAQLADDLTTGEIAKEARSKRDLLLRTVNKTLETCGDKENLRRLSGLIISCNTNTPFADNAREYDEQYGRAAVFLAEAFMVFGVVSAMIGISAGIGTGPSNLMRMVSVFMATSALSISMGLLLTFINTVVFLKPLRNRMVLEYIRLESVLTSVYTTENLMNYLIDNNVTIAKLNAELLKESLEVYQQMNSLRENLESINVETARITGSLVAGIDQLRKSLNEAATFNNTSGLITAIGARTGEIVNAVGSIKKTLEHSPIFNDGNGNKSNGPGLHRSIFK